jgi:hypothetical protein
VFVEFLVSFTNSGWSFGSGSNQAHHTHHGDDVLL